jgi:sugar phosphate isomerase/epimerase
VDLARMSLNTMTVPSLGLDDVVDAAVARGIRWIAPWRQLLQGTTAGLAGRRIRDAGLSVSSLCRGGMFTAATAAERRAALDDNRRAIEQAGELEALCLVLVCGPVVDRDVSGSFEMVVDGIAALVEEARAAGVRLGVEPLHPMMAADRSVVTTLRDAQELLRRINAQDVLGIVVDAYHVWWDRQLAELLAADGSGEVLGLHVSDWTTPLTGAVTSGRGMMGDGVIDLPALAAAVPYGGPVEVEVLSDTYWARPPDEVLDLAVERFVSNV